MSFRILYINIPISEGEQYLLLKSKVSSIDDSNWGFRYWVTRDRFLSPGGQVNRLPGDKQVTRDRFLSPGGQVNRLPSTCGQRRCIRPRPNPVSRCNCRTEAPMSNSCLNASLCISLFNFWKLLEFWTPVSFIICCHT